MRALSVALLLCLGCAGTIFDTSYTIFDADYVFSLSEVQRPENAKSRYGNQAITKITNDTTYSIAFEDELIKILWAPSPEHMSFRAINKTDHSVKIIWDEAAYVDENGSSHRIMHAGIKYDDRENPQPASVIVRRGSVTDLIYPTDYVSWDRGGPYTAGKWDERPLFAWFDYRSSMTTGKYRDFLHFTNTAKSNIGKTCQVLLPLQIQDITNDYIFTFHIDDVTTTQEHKKR